MWANPPRRRVLAHPLHRASMLRQGLCDELQRREQEIHCCGLPEMTPRPPRPGEHYDVLVLGAGWGGLTAASLLAKAGRRVAVLEARDRAGGCGQSFTREGFTFCAEMQYLMG